MRIYLQHACSFRSPLSTCVEQSNRWISSVSFFSSFLSFIFFCLDSRFDEDSQCCTRAANKFSSCNSGAAATVAAIDVGEKALRRTYVFRAVRILPFLPFCSSVVRRVNFTRMRIRLYHHCTVLMWNFSRLCFLRPYFDVCIKIISLFWKINKNYNAIYRNFVKH